jgi:hypothetical protein
MTFEDLRVFVTVAAERSFSRAARKLRRTQPAVSQAIRRLEDDAGERLIERAILFGRQPAPDVDETGVAVLRDEPLEKRRAGQIRERSALVGARGIELLVCRQLALERPPSQEGRPPRSVRTACMRDASFDVRRIAFDRPAR